jgi:hypothetical protein
VTDRSSTPTARIDAGHNIALQTQMSQLRVSQRGLDDVAPGAFALRAGKKLSLLAQGAGRSSSSTAVRISGTVVNKPFSPSCLVSP